MQSDDRNDDSSCHTRNDVTFLDPLGSTAHVRARAMHPSAKPLPRVPPPQRRAAQSQRIGGPSTLTAPPMLLLLLPLLHASRRPQTRPQPRFLSKQLLQPQHAAQRTPAGQQPSSQQTPRWHWNRAGTATQWPALCSRSQRSRSREPAAERARETRTLFSMGNQLRINPLCAAVAGRGRIDTPDSITAP